jgi:hypothetical protein
MQPDVPSASCCGEADAYWADEIHVRDGKTYAIVTDDRPDEPRGRPHVDIGTEIEIPDHKLKWDKSNPTGHGIVFLSRTRYVFCYVQPGGVWRHVASVVADYPVGIWVQLLDRGRVPRLSRGTLQLSIRCSSIHFRPSRSLPVSDGDVLIGATWFGRVSCAGVADVKPTTTNVPNSPPYKARMTASQTSV